MARCYCTGEGLISNPRLRVKSSGHGGSGYVLPARKGDEWKYVKNADGDQIKARLTNGRTTVLPGVTTITGVWPNGGIVQWAVDNTAAYAVANIDALLNRTEEQGYGMLRWYYKRAPDMDEPGLDIRSHHVGVLNDAAELGTVTHDWVEADLNDWFEPDVHNDYHAEMIEQWLLFRSEHVIKPLATEMTVFNLELGNAGTLDLIVDIDGQVDLSDLKTARGTHDTHWEQIAALDHAKEAYEEGEDGFWEQVEVPEYTGLSIIHLRPSDIDSKGNYMAPFCKVNPAVDMDLHWQGFQASLSKKKVEYELKKRGRERDYKYKEEA